MCNRKTDLLVQSFIGDEMPPTDFYKTKQNMHYYCITYMQLMLQPYVAMIFGLQL